MHATRRHALVRAALAIVLATLPAAAQTSGERATMSRITAYAFSFAALDGRDIRLAAHAGKPILVVNTASLCGYTPQYALLQELWTRYRDRGLLIVGVPSNDFGAARATSSRPRATATARAFPSPPRRR